MAKNKPRWKPVCLWDLVRQRREGTLSNETGLKILEEWDKLPRIERFQVRPFLCGEEIRFKAPGSAYLPQFCRFELRMNMNDASLSRHTVVLVTGGPILSNTEQRAVGLLEEAGCIVLIPGRDKIPAPDEPPEKTLDQMLRSLLESQTFDFPHITLTKWACLTQQAIILTCDAVQSSIDPVRRVQSAFYPTSIIKRSPLKQRAPPATCTGQAKTLYCLKLCMDT